MAKPTQTGPSSSPADRGAAPGRRQGAPSKPLVDLSQDAQWDIINKTGVLHKVKEHDKAKKAAAESAPSEEPLLLVALLMSVPMVMFHGMLDYLVHYQYGFLEEFTIEYVLRRELLMYPALVIFTYGTGRVKHSRIAQALFAVAAVGAGCLLIHYTTADETFGSMLKAPGLSCIWIMLIIQMDLTAALASLAVCIVYYHREFLLSFFDESKWTNAFTIKGEL
ncbi:hypothetical protein HK105_204140 [Polyrhizophydium stewartii]|uniref:DUF7719 domain-containing protein n=1 Tax=Polyrhizophydium stewartii TaxID=2732419 RepID=A0ABR4NAA6_9FUNG|nr:hypothetical protein HK105_004296 [Polyrhizophydium stewartii]